MSKGIPKDAVNRALWGLGFPVGKKEVRDHEGQSKGCRLTSRCREEQVTSQK